MQLLLMLGEQNYPSLFHIPILRLINKKFRGKNLNLKAKVVKSELYNSI